MTDAAPDFSARTGEDFVPRREAVIAAAASAASPTPCDPDGIPILTDAEKTAEAMILELSQRLQAKIAEALPALIEATVRDYLAEQAAHLAPRRD